MSQLLFWTAAEPGLITKTFGASLKSFRPNVPPHQFVPFVEGKLIEPGEGDVVLCCGVKALDALRVAGIFPKNRSLDALREKPVKLGAGWVMVTFDPGVIQSQPEKREILDWDVRLAHRLLTTGSLVPKIGDYRWVSSFAPLIAEIEEMYEKIGQAGEGQLRHRNDGPVPLVSRQGFRLLLALPTSLEARTCSI